MYNKIQPQQIQLHSFSSPSGSIVFSQGSDYVYGNLNNSITGAFNVQGSLTINGMSLYSIDASNTIAGSGNFDVNGRNNIIGGTGNLSTNSRTSTIGGLFNSDINGTGNIFNDFSSRSTIIGGRSVTVPSGVSGAVVIKDSTSSSSVATASNTLTIDFASGTFFKKRTDFEQNVYFQQNAYFSSFGSGLFSGDANVLGTLYQNGVATPTYAMYSGLSGYTTGVNGLVNNTGTYFNNQITALSGYVTGVAGLAGDAVLVTGTQTIAGDKTFSDQIELTNQAATSTTSALTRELGDLRYGPYSDISSATVSVTASTTFVTVISVTLPIGDYQIDAFLASLHGTIGGCKIRLGASNNIRVGLTDNYGRPASPAIATIIDDAYNSSTAAGTRSDTGGTDFRRTITGYIKILTDNTVISLDYSQQVSDPTASVARKWAHLIVRPLI